MLEFRTQGFNGYSVKYSPFFDSRIAVASAANFGLVGNGRLYVLGLTANGVVAEKYFDTQDSLFDTAWSEAHENQLLTAGGDGSVQPQADRLSGGGAEGGGAGRGALLPLSGRWSGARDLPRPSLRAARLRC